MKKTITVTLFIAAAALSLTGCKAAPEAAPAPAETPAVVEVVETPAAIETPAVAVNTEAEFEEILKTIFHASEKIVEDLDTADFADFEVQGQKIIDATKDGYVLTTGDPEADMAWQAIMNAAYAYGAECVSGDLLTISEAAVWFAEIGEENTPVLVDHFES